MHFEGTPLLSHEPSPAYTPSVRTVDFGKPKKPHRRSWRGCFRDIRSTKSWFGDVYSTHGGTGTSDATHEAGGLMGLPSDIRQQLNQISVATAVVFMRDGAFLSKYRRPGRLSKAHARMFKVDMDTLELRWLSPDRDPTSTVVPFEDVYAICVRDASKFFRKRPEEKDLGIEILAAHYPRLRVVCPTKKEYLLWLKGFGYCKAKADLRKKRSAAVTKADYIKRLWELADESSSGSVEVNELVDLFRKLHWAIDFRHVLWAFEVVDVDHSGFIDFLSFRDLVSALMVSRTLETYFVELRDRTREILKQDGFETFLKDIQFEPEHLAVVHARHFSRVVRPLSQPGGMTEAGFTRLMTSEFNSFIDPAKLEESDDKSLNLNECFISTCSHPFGMLARRIHRSTGTSLTANEMERHLRLCLGLGFKCIRLAVRQSKKGHHYYVVPQGVPAFECLSKLKFSHALTLIKNYGFSVSPLPVILFLNLSTKMAMEGLVNIALSALGDSLLKPQDLPEPLRLESLLNKILVSTIQIMRTNPFYWEYDGAENERLLAVSNITVPLLHPARPIGDITRRSLQPHPLTPLEREDAETLSKIVSLPRKAIHAKAVAERHPSQVFGISYDKFNCLANHDPNGIILASKASLGCCFPDDELHAHSFARAVRLGMQMPGISMGGMGMSAALHFSLFRQNGGAGYVPKPRILYSDDFDILRPEMNDQEPPIHLIVQILEGRMLPRGWTPFPCRPDFRDSFRPLVVFGILGVPGDNVTVATHPSLSTDICHSWPPNEANFIVSVPSISFLWFEIHNRDTSEVVAMAAGIVSTLRQGIRWVPLRNPGGHPNDWAGLLIKLELRPVKRETQRAPPIGELAAPISSRAKPKPRLRPGAPRLQPKGIVPAAAGGVYEGPSAGSNLTLIEETAPITTGATR